MLLLVLALGALTALKSRPLDVWWNTEPEQLTRLDALESSLAAARAPIVVTDVSPLRVLELAHRLPDTATLRLGPDAPDAITADDWPRVVVVTPSDDLLVRARAAATRANVTLVRGDDGLAWRVVPEAR